MFEPPVDLGRVDQALFDPIAGRHLRMSSWRHRPGYPPYAHPFQGVGVRSNLNLVYEHGISWKWAGLVCGFGAVGAARAGQYDGTPGAGTRAAGGLGGHRVRGASAASVFPRTAVLHCCGADPAGNCAHPGILRPSWPCGATDAGAAGITCCVV
jgi:hypothetical protein